MLTSMRAWLATRIHRVFITKEEGASLVEYALLVALIAVACIGGIIAIGAAIQAQFLNISERLGT